MSNHPLTPASGGQVSDAFMSSSLFSSRHALVDCGARVDREWKKSGESSRDAWEQ